MYFCVNFYALNTLYPKIAASVHNSIMNCDLDVVPIARMAAAVSTTHATGRFENYRLRRVCVRDKTAVAQLPEFNWL
jgi:hypothetical protein